MKHVPARDLHCESTMMARDARPVGVNQATPERKQRTLRVLLCLLALLMASGIALGGGPGRPAMAGAPIPGGVFVTGHDPDYHSIYGNQVGAQHLLQKAVRFVTSEKPSPKLLLVTDLRNPGADGSDPRLGLQAAGLTFDTADYGSGTPGVLELRNVNFRAYDALIVASDVGGWLRQEELDLLNERAVDIMSYINNGGGLVVLNESGSRQPQPGVYTGTTHDRYAFISPSLVSTVLDQEEVNFTVTPFGQSAGFTDADANGNYSHSYFDRYVGLEVIDMDSQGRAISLGVRGQALLFSITGRIAQNGRPVPGIAISVAPGAAAATDASGYYTVTNLLAGTYTLTPFSRCYQFAPATLSVSVPPDGLAQDFQAAPPPGQDCAWLLGPKSGSIKSSAVFTAGLSTVPVAPVTYLWRATEQIDTSYVATATQSMSYTWDRPGPKLITVTVTGATESAAVDYRFTVYTHLYLPLLLRGG
jgi:hypothetical protein